jgi:hypothetical protein
MGLDPIGGRATNLMGFREARARQGDALSDEPEDIYQWVSDLVCRRMEFDAAVNGPNAEAARQLLAIMDRELSKNATMTTPYGVTLRTIFKALCEKEAIRGLKDSEKCATYLAKLLVECIPEVAVESGRIMEWLREVAGILAKSNRGMMWTTPVGFVVLHDEPRPARGIRPDLFRTRPAEFPRPATKSPSWHFSAGSAPDWRPRYSAGPLVSLLFCLIGCKHRSPVDMALGKRYKIGISDKVSALPTAAG